MFHKSINQFFSLNLIYIWPKPAAFVSMDYFPFILTFVLLLLQHTPVYCSAIKPSILTAKLGEHQKAPLRHSFERHLICGGNLSHKQPRGDFNIYSAVCSAYVSFGKQLTLAHYTQMKADLQTGQRPHSLCGEVSPSYEAMALFSPCSAYAYWTASRAHCKREGPGWHDVYCTSIWSWCILRCKQGFKLYAPPCQRLRMTLAICLSAGGWEERVPGPVCSCVHACQCVFVCPCSHVSIRATCSISISPCTRVSPQMHG